jgi:uncharacterized protein YecE (DUF72 family)
VTAAERFRYLYSEAELAEWVPRTKRLAQLASRVHLLMNNCYQDYGVRNAAELAEMLAGEGLDDGEQSEGLGQSKVGRRGTAQDAPVRADKLFD